MYRVYSKKDKKWVTDKIYMSPNGDLYILKNSIFSGAKLELLDEGMYVCHDDINLYDKNDVLVYEGDYIEAKVSEDKTVIGMVAYAHELSSYVILCVNSDEFYISHRLCLLIDG
jgi:hypothetical protein